MINKDNPNSLQIRLKYYTWLLFFFWTICICASFQWNLTQKQTEIEDLARTSARVAFEKDIIYRRWNAGHGGVYAPITSSTQPNPYLKIFERDIKSPSGIALTKINPAFMTRQAHEIGNQLNGVLGHITSLNPIRPQNKPDRWEAQALKAFESGAKEVSAIETIKDIQYFRLMGPLITEVGCLKCHAEQGYKIGDIRGGISVSVPMEPLKAIEKNFIKGLFWAHSALWLIGLAGILIGTTKLRTQMKMRMEAEAQVQLINTQLEQRVKNRTAALENANTELLKLKHLAESANQAKSEFLMNMSHELRTPLNGVISASQMISTAKSKSDLNEIQQIIALSSQTLLRTVERILDFSKSRDGHLKLNIDSFNLDAILAALNTSFFHKGEFIYIDLKIEWDRTTIPNTLIGDGQRLAEVFDMLLENASKFSLSENMVNLTITVDSKTADDVVLKFCVQDNGIGIEKINLNKIFEPFYQVDASTTRPYDGVGIGLAIAKQLIQLMGGDIQVQSIPGKGSTFCFTAQFQLPDNPSTINVAQATTNSDTQTSTAFKQTLSALDPIKKEQIKTYINKLAKALEASDPIAIQKSATQLSNIDIPEIKTAMKKIKSYDYDAAHAILLELLNIN